MIPVGRRKKKLPEVDLNVDWLSIESSREQCFSDSEVHSEHWRISFRSLMHQLIFPFLLLNIDRAVSKYVNVLVNLSSSLLFDQVLLHIFGSIAVKVNRCLGLLYLPDELVILSL